MYSQIACAAQYNIELVGNHLTKDIHTIMATCLYFIVMYAVTVMISGASLGTSLGMHILFQESLICLIDSSINA